MTRSHRHSDSSVQFMPGLLIVDPLRRYRAPLVRTISGDDRQFQESITGARPAVLLDPLSPIIKAALPDTLSLAGQNDAALEQLKLAFEMDSHFPKCTRSFRRNLYEKR